jgi:acetolactate synthase I/II/III large subunit
VTDSGTSVSCAVQAYLSTGTYSAWTVVSGVRSRHCQGLLSAGIEWKDDPKMNPAKSVIETLRRRNVDTLFGLDGDHVIYLFDALSDVRNIRVITVMHENNAAIAAEVYARVTGKPGVVLTTAGPGATNAVSGIAGAYAAGVPVVHICGGVASDAAREAFHGVDDPRFLVDMFAPVTKWSVRVDRTGEIGPVLDRAFDLAVRGRPGPVHVEIPVSTLTSDDPVADAGSESFEMLEDDSTASSLDDLLDRIKSSGRIAIVAGKNAMWEAVSGQLVALAEHLSAPVAHAWDAHGVMPTVHPLSIGLWREGNSGEFVEAMLDGADLVLGVGVRQETETDRFLSKRLGGRFVRLDCQDTRANAGHLAAGSVDTLATVLRSLVERSPERPTDPTVLGQCEQARRLLREGLAVEIDRHKNARPWPIGLALESLARRMTPEMLVISDVSNVKIWTPLQLPTFNSLSHLQSGSWGAMGYAVPGVLAAGIARPDRRVVGLVGDASFLMGSSDFGTICERRLPVVIAVHADRQIGMIHYSLKQTFGRTYLTEVPAADFVGFAEAFGARGIRVDDPHDIDDAWDEALALRTTVLLELRAGHDFPRPYPIQRMFDQARERAQVNEPS